MLVYISQPMHDRSIKDIELARAYAIKRVNELGHDVQDDYVRDESGLSRDTSLTYLSSNIAKMAECDAVFFIDDWETSPRCVVEHKICEQFGLKVFNG